MIAKKTNSSKNSLPRRDFLARASMAGIGGAAGLVSVAGSAHAISPDERRLNAAAFQKYIGSTFRLKSESQTHDVRLTEVEEQPADAGRPAFVRQRPFSLFFTASKDCGFQDGLYRLRHPLLGVIDAFVSSVDDRSRRTTLQVVFG